jgi:hypothetical protein
MVAVTANAFQLLDAARVDQLPGRDEPQRDHGNQAVAVGQRSLASPRSASSSTALDKSSADG